MIKVGDTFGGLEIVGDAGETGLDKDYKFWWCLCRCGREFVEMSNVLEEGNRTECRMCTKLGKRRRD